MEADKKASSVQAVSATTFDQIVLASATPVVVDFWAPWCGPCRALAPVYHDLAAEMGDRVRFVSVNVDEEPELAERFRVASIPTLKAFRDGREIATQLGGSTKERLRNTVEQWLRSDEAPTPVGAGPDQSA